MKMKARCNESIKRLITSTDPYLDDGSTVEARFNFANSEILQCINVGSQPTVVYDYYLGKECDTTQILNYYTGFIPLGFLSQAPSKFDMSLSGEFLFDLCPGQFKQMREEAINRARELIDVSSYHNSLVEAILMGRAIYSWVLEHKSYSFKRCTESHLPEGEYVFKVYGVKYGFVSWHNVDPRGSGSGTYSPKSGCDEATCSLSNDVLTIHLTLVSKKTKTKGHNKIKVDADPEESVDMLLNEWDNIK